MWKEKIGSDITSPFMDNLRLFKTIEGTIIGLSHVMVEDFDMEKINDYAVEHGLNATYLGVSFYNKETHKLLLWTIP